MHNTSQGQQGKFNGVPNKTGNNNNINPNRQTMNVKNNNLTFTSQVNTVSWSTTCAELDDRQMPEVPWNGDVDYIRIGRAVGLPVIP